MCFRMKGETPFQKVLHPISGWVLFLSKVKEECISSMHEYLSIFTCTQIIEMHQINFMMEYLQNFNEYIPTTHHSDVTKYVTIMTHRQWRFGWIRHLKYEYKTSIDMMMTTFCTYIVKYAINNYILNHTKCKKRYQSHPKYLKWATGVIWDLPSKSLGVLHRKRSSHFEATFQGAFLLTWINFKLSLDK